MKKITLFLLVCCLFNTVTSEAKDSKKGKKERSDFYIKGFGWGAFGEIGTMTRYAQYTDNYGSGDIEFEEVKRPVSVSLIYVGLNNHFLLKKIGNEKSVSLNFYPTIGMSMVKDRILNLTLPFMVCYNVGNVSTYKSKRNTGVTLGLGAEYIQPGMISFFNDSWSEWVRASFSPKYIIQPCAAIGLRYFTKGDHALEVNLKYGMNRSSKVYDIYGQMPAGMNVPSTNHWFRLSFVHYIGY